MSEPGELDEDRAHALRLVRVSHETIVRLDQFVELFVRWQRAVQLVANSTLPKLWTRHIADSVQLVDLAPDAKTWADLGSGGGFPGLVIALAIADRPGAFVHLIESNTRKAAFLREAARITRAPVKVHAERIESVSKRISPVDVVTARALASLPRIIEFSEPFLRAGALGIFLRGQDVDNELTEAAKSWKIQSKVLPSQTDPRGKILLVESAAQRPLTPR
ncbi:MAG: 16S rRNA (guanine(527)-N(7))-methyltransferase RsmG [Xanthobacteraceae bacterium]